MISFSALWQLNLNPLAATQFSALKLNPARTGSLAQASAAMPPGTSKLATGPAKNLSHGPGCHRPLHDDKNTSNTNILRRRRRRRMIITVVILPPIKVGIWTIYAVFSSSQGIGVGGQSYSRFLAYTVSQAHISISCGGRPRPC